MLLLLFFHKDLIWSQDENHVMKLTRLETREKIHSTKYASGHLCARDEDHEMKLTRLETRELI